MLESSGSRLPSVWPLRISDTPPYIPPAELYTVVGLSQGLSSVLLHIEPFSHTPNFGPPHFWPSPRFPSQSAPSSVPLPRLREFLGSQFHSLSMRRV